MKTKRLLLVVPAIATLASCSAKVDVYRDMFKDARDLTAEEKEEILHGLDTRQYRYTGTRVIETYMDDEKVGNKESAVRVDFSNDEYDTSCTYTLDGDVKLQASNENNPSLYEKFKGLVYSWNGHVLVGNFDVTPYDYNTKLLNCVSAKFTKQQLKDVKTGSFTLNLSSPVYYSDGEIKHQVDRFNVTYASHRITSYSCSYRVIIEDADIVVVMTYAGSFDYTYVH